MARSGREVRVCVMSVCQRNVCVCLPVDYGLEKNASACIAQSYARTLHSLSLSHPSSLCACSEPTQNSMFEFSSGFPLALRIPVIVCVRGVSVCSS